MSIDIDLSGSTQFGTGFGVSTNNPNGYTSGELAGVRVEDNGMVYATYTNGQSQLQGKLCWRILLTLKASQKSAALLGLKASAQVRQ